MNELTHLDLFSGIGGFKFAAEWAGFRTVGFAEINPFSSRILKKTWPDIENLGDVTITANFKRFAGCTVVTAGYPCQPDSSSGKRRGKEDNRWLWPAAFDVIKTVRPTWFIGENVFGHISGGLDSVLSDLEGISYSQQSFVIPACAIGARHRRDRVWIIAHFDGVRKQQPEGDVEKSRRWNRGCIEQDSDSHAPGNGRSILGAEVIAEDGLGGELAAHTIEQKNRWASKVWGIPPLTDWNQLISLVLRGVHGISNRSHRIAALGNAIVPQVVAPFFHWIAQIERGEIT